MAETKSKIDNTGIIIKSNNVISKNGIGNVQIKMDNRQNVDYNISSKYILTTNKDYKYNDINISKKDFNNLKNGKKVQIVEPEYSIKVVGKIKEFKQIPYKEKNKLFMFYNNSFDNLNKVAFYSNKSIPKAYRTIHFMSSDNYIKNYDNTQYLKVVN